MTSRGVKEKNTPHRKEDRRPKTAAQTLDFGLWTKKKRGHIHINLNLSFYPNLPPVTYIMTTSESLNAGANTFVPGGGGDGSAANNKDTAVAGGDPNDSFTAYANMMDDIEAEVEAADTEELVGAMNNVGMGGGSAAAPTGLPAHLAGHAHEFWFPEARDCSCCNGYKHGCQCAPTHGGVCKCSGGVPGSGPPPGAPMGGRGGGGGRGRGGGGRGTGSVLCKFFMSPQGCRFGESCRFSHG